MKESLHIKENERMDESVKHVFHTGDCCSFHVEKLQVEFDLF